MTTAQFLYDLRELTGFISGGDLHDLFERLTGDPAPKGATLINLQDAMRACPALLNELMARDIVQHIERYSEISLPPTPMPLGMMDMDNSAKWVEAAMAVKVAQHG